MVESYIYQEGSSSLNTMSNPQIKQPTPIDAIEKLKDNFAQNAIKMDYYKDNTGLNWVTGYVGKNKDGAEWRVWSSYKPPMDGSDANYVATGLDESKAIDMFKGIVGKSHEDITKTLNDLSDINKSIEMPKEIKRADLRENVVLEAPVMTDLGNNEMFETEIPVYQDLKVVQTWETAKSAAEYFIQKAVDGDAGSLIRFTERVGLEKAKKAFSKIEGVNSEWLGEFVKGIIDTNIEKAVKTGKPYSQQMGRKAGKGAGHIVSKLPDIGKLSDKEAEDLKVNLKEYLEKLQSKSEGKTSSKGKYADWQKWSTIDPNLWQMEKTEIDNIREKALKGLGPKGRPLNPYWEKAKSEAVNLTNEHGHDDPKSKKARQMWYIIASKAFGGASGAKEELYKWGMKKAGDDDLEKAIGEGTMPTDAQAAALAKIDFDNDGFPKELSGRSDIKTSEDVQKWIDEQISGAGVEKSVESDPAKAKPALASLKEDEPTDSELATLDGEEIKTPAKYADLKLQKSAKDKCVYKARVEKEPKTDKPKMTDLKAKQVNETTEPELTLKDKEVKKEPKLANLKVEKGCPTSKKQARLFGAVAGGKKTEAKGLSKKEAKDKLKGKKLKNLPEKKKGKRGR